MPELPARRACGRFDRAGKRSQQNRDLPRLQSEKKSAVAEGRSISHSKNRHTIEFRRDPVTNLLHLPHPRLPPNHRFPQRWNPAWMPTRKSRTSASCRTRRQSPLHLSRARALRYRRWGGSCRTGHLNSFRMARHSGAVSFLSVRTGVHAPCRLGRLRVRFRIAGNSKGNPS
jgi:hypothetical protein